jgi:hypothetical protein
LGPWSLGSWGNKNTEGAGDRRGDRHHGIRAESPAIQSGRRAAPTPAAERRHRRAIQDRAGIAGFPLTLEGSRSAAE